MDIEFPSRARLERSAGLDVSDLPPFSRVRRHRDQPQVDDVPGATVDALGDISALDDLPDGAEVAVTAGSRGIHDVVAVLATAVAELQDRGYEPFVMPAMGSHGGATAEGQLEALEALGITPERVGCEFRSSMDVREVGTDADGRPVFAAVDALEADAVLLVNRVKPHTDYSGDYESGLCKMAVVGLGKHRGAEEMHNAALARGFPQVVPERARILLETTPVVGGIAILENARERTADVVGVPAGDVMDREPRLLERARELLPTLPVDDLDLLVVREFGKDVSGTGLDTNVVGRQWFHGQPEPDAVEVTRIYVRSLTPASHGNALGVGLADFVHRKVVEAIDFGDTYVNIATSGEPRRAKLPFVVPADETVFKLAPSTTGVADPADLRVAIVANTLEPDDLLVSEPVAAELRDRPDVTVGDAERLRFDADGELENGS